jgi:hypothetical protein
MSTSMHHSRALDDSVRDLVSRRLLAQVMPTWSTRRSCKILRPPYPFNSYRSRASPQCPAGPVRDSRCRRIAFNFAVR